MTAGLVFNVQRFSLQDGPGLRSTVFLKGCPLRCGWCHNPESRSPRPQVVRLRQRCMACGRCAAEELAAAASGGPSEAEAEACPTGALQVVGRWREAAELAEELLRDRIFFDESGGGVTFSGGEPLLQPAFLAEAMDRLRAEGVHLALDTCGFGRWEDLRALAARADLVLYDLKLMDDARHRQATGVPVRPILDNLRALAETGVAVWGRVPIVPGVNDDEANLAATADFLAALPGLRRIELLPYHATGEAKFARIGLDCALAGTAPPSPARMAEIQDLFLTRGLSAAAGGRP